MRHLRFICPQRKMHWNLGVLLTHSLLQTTASLTPHQPIAGSWTYTAGDLGALISCCARADVPPKTSTAVLPSPAPRAPQMEVA